MPEQVANQIERVILLKTFEAFRNLAPHELAALAEHARPRQFQAGQALVRAGMPLRSLHFIVNGKVEMRQGSGPTLVLGAQDVVGGLSALIGDERTAAVRALDDTATLQLNRDDLQDVFEDNVSVLLGVLRTLARAQRSVRERLGLRAGFPEAKASVPPRSSSNPGLVDKLFSLRNAMDFAHFRVEALADLAQEAETLKRSAGEELWQLGDIADHSLLLMQGVIEGTTESGRQAFDFGPGALVGGIDSLAEDPRWYRARAKTDVVALCIRVQHFLDVIEDNAEFGMDLLRVLASTLRTLQRGLADPRTAAPLI